MIRIRLAAAVAGVALLLTACQGPPVPPEEDGSCMPTAAGEASEQISVDGQSAVVPRVQFDALPEVFTTQRTIVRAGSGLPAERGALATFAYAVYDGSSGELIDEVGFEGPPVQTTVDDAHLVPGMMKALLCSPQGARIVAVIPPVDAFGDGTGFGEAVSGDDPLVIVVDLVAVAADRADGVPQDLDEESLPSVAIGASGEPRVRIPPVSPPTDLVTRVLKVGDGDLVTKGATVTVEYIGVDWKSSRTFDSSWNSDALVQRPTTEFIAGFGSALQGVTVGSQVLVVVPPGLGYGDAGNREFGLQPDDTVVFVIDVLAAIQPPGPGE